jgi:RimJ/RimL family protein N-acetyltransferase
VKLSLLSGESDELAELQRVLEGAPAYAERITGHPPGAADAQSLFMGLPEGIDYSDKFVWGVLADGVMVGCIDVIRGWPNSHTALIGLFLIDEAHARQGLGRAAYAALEVAICQWPSIRVVRAAVVATNAAVLPFWRQMGLAETGEVKPYQYDKVRSQCIILSKTL